MRILEVCTALDGGGVDRYLLNYCSRIDDIQFDFVVVVEKTGILETLLEERGCNIYHIPRISKGVIKNYKALADIIQKENYDAIHSHLGHKSIVALWCAKRSGINVRITHAHMAFAPESFKAKFSRKILTFLVKRLSTSLAACGIDAAKWLWGEKSYDNGLITIQNNAIETGIFTFSQKTRDEVRSELGIESKLVVGHVGRLSEQKNQIYALQIFKEIVKKCENATFILIGRGECEKVIIEKIKELNLEESVRLLGVRSDVPRLLNAMDVFLFPSLFEGLPFTLIETQCNGLMALCSDVITRHVKISDCILFESLNSPAEVWAEKAIELSMIGHKENSTDDVISAGYDIESEAQKLKDYYIEKIRGYKG